MLRCGASEKSCESPPTQLHGHRHETDCPEPFRFQKTCQFECDSGYKLPLPGVSKVECVVTTVDGSEYLKWSDGPSDCKGSAL